MFNSKEILALQTKVADLERALRFEQRERAADAERLQYKIDIEAQNKRLDHIEARYKAEAEALACRVGEKLAAEYSAKAVTMAGKCAADFADATGKLTEKFLAVIKEMKPAAAVAGTVQVLPVVGQPQNVEVKNG